jgi:hypothetical protein
MRPGGRGLGRREAGLERALHQSGREEVHRLRGGLVRVGRRHALGQQKRPGEHGLFGQVGLAIGPDRRVGIRDFHVHTAGRLRPVVPRGHLHGRLERGRRTDGEASPDGRGLVPSAGGHAGPDDVGGTIVLLDGDICLARHIESYFLAHNAPQQLNSLGIEGGEKQRSPPAWVTASTGSALLDWAQERVQEFG